MELSKTYHKQPGKVVSERSEWTFTYQVVVLKERECTFTFILGSWFIVWIVFLSVYSNKTKFIFFYINMCACAQNIKKFSVFFRTRMFNYYYY